MTFISVMQSYDGYTYPAEIDDETPVTVYLFDSNFDLVSEFEFNSMSDIPFSFVITYAKYHCTFDVYQNQIKITLRYKAKIKPFSSTRFFNRVLYKGFNPFKNFMEVLQ